MMEPRYYCSQCLLRCIPKMQMQMQMQMKMKMGPRIASSCHCLSAFGCPCSYLLDSSYGTPGMPLLLPSSLCQPYPVRRSPSPPSVHLRPPHQPR